MTIAAATLTAATVMDGAASLMNDTAKSIYTYAAQIPYLNLALQELQEYFEVNEIPVVETVTAAVMTVPAGTTAIGYAASGLKLPDDLVEPQMLWERASGIDPYTNMTRINALPKSLDGTLNNQFIWYVWESQEIRFLAANQSNDIKMNYTRQIFAVVTASGDLLNVVNAKTFLEYRTAGLCSEFIGENPTRAVALNNYATSALDRAIGIGSRGRQAIVTRRRPFRSAYKSRSFN